MRYSTIKNSKQEKAFRQICRVLLELYPEMPCEIAESKALKILKEREKAEIPLFDYRFRDFYNKQTENIIFTQSQAKGMYDILVEIHDALSDKTGYAPGIEDKSMNKTSNKLNTYEMGWLLSIEELLKKLKSSQD